ncbi:MAG: Hsp20/alpha crystallin family protein [Methylophilaceae bacterium]|nr:Hsp20/alpha crystallin family protein [Methylophilaceae bacterium]
MSLDQLKDQFGSIWNSVTEGWRELWHSAAGAITRFVPGDKTNLPDANEIEDDRFMPTRTWAMIGGEVFEDETRLVVRLELPGMDKEDIQIEVRSDELRVSGEKRFVREDTHGRWRVMQRAYGSFQRVVPLPCDVLPDASRATYQNGVLRIELTKDAQKKRGHYLKVE